LEGLDEMEELLLEVETAAKEKRRSDFISAADKISRLSPRLDESLQDFTHQILLLRGPTEIPNLNLLLSLNDDHTRYHTDVTRSRFQQALVGEIELVQRTAAALSAKNSDTPTWPALKEVFRAHVQWLERLYSELDTEHGDRTDLVAPLTKTYEDINRLLPAVCAELSDAGQTDLPEVNRLLTTLSEVREGRQSLEPLLAMMEELEDSLERLGEGIGEAPAGTVDERELELLAEALALFMAGLDELYIFDETRDLKALELAETKVREFASVLQYFYLCCDALQRPREEDGLLVTSHLEPVYQAVDDLIQQRVSVDDYLAVLDRFQNHLMSQARKPAVGGFIREIETILGGLGELRRYPEHRHEGPLREGIRLIDGGVKSLRGAVAAQ